MPVLRLVPVLATALLPLAAPAAPIPTRTPLGTLPISPGKQVDRVETTRVAFAPGQEMPRHKHNVPVVCFVAKGTFLVSIADRPIRSVRVGDVTLEPAGAIVNFFRNASRKAPGELLCASLAGDADKVLNVMLDGPREPR